MSKPCGLAECWKITNEGDNGSTNQSTESALCSAKEEDSGIPKFEEFIDKGPEKVIELIERWLLWTGDDACQIDVLGPEP